MVHEISQLKKSKETNELRYERYNYIAELINDINKYNDVLTQWIKLQQGELSLHIERLLSTANIRYSSKI